MQRDIKNSTGEHTVLGNAIDLMEGTLKPADLPTIRVWADNAGKIWTLDHRRLASFRLANVTEIPVQWVGPEVVKNQRGKMTTKVRGASIKLKLGRGSAMTVE